MTTKLSEATERYRELLGHSSDMQGHMETLHAWVVRLQPEWVIELGVRSGISTVSLLAGLEHNGRGMLWSCDIRPPQDMATWILSHPQCQFAQGDDSDPSVLDPSPPDTCQLLFIDSSHIGEHTAHELEVYGKRVEPGGVILCHDVDEPDCGHAVREWSLKKHNAQAYCYGLSATLV